MPKVLLNILFIASVALVLVSCLTVAGQPRLAGAAIDPSELVPGDTAIITVKVLDRHALVHKVEGKVLEESSTSLTLRDDGVKSEDGPEWDADAGDGIWSIRVDVPIVAPSGEFMLELTAYLSDGRPLTVRDDGGVVVPLKTTLPVTIRYVEE